MKLTPYAFEVSFDGHRSQYQQKAQLAHTTTQAGHTHIGAEFLKRFHPFIPYQRLIGAR